MKVLIISDLHCGHIGGLTPPKWQQSEGAIALLQKRQWACFVAGTSYAPDALFVNGDCIDGIGTKSGGTELITTDRHVQAEMAIQCIKATKAKKIWMTYGTPYHTGEAEDFEDVVADGVRAEKIGGHEWIDVRGIVFNLKHFVSAGGLPHTRHTSSSREHLWAQQWNIEDGTPVGDVIVRSHVHYHQYCGAPGWLALTTPGLQAFGGKYGVRRCSGVVHWGWINFDIYRKGSYTWSANVQHMAEQRPHVSKIP